MKDKESIIRKLNKTQKIEAIIAVVLSLILISVVSVYSWFALSKSLETMTKVMEPNTLDILAGNHHPIINFELNGIDLEKMAEEGKAEYRVFSINTGGYKVAYMLQLAYTTNIPFKYTLYSATWKTGVTEQNSSGTYVEYHPLDGDVISYYELDEEIVLTPLNEDTAHSSSYGRVIATNSGAVYDLTYDAGDNPDIYAVPVYRQSDIIRSHKEDGNYEYYVLKIEWDEDADESIQGFSEWNKPENNKETDIVYIVASRQTS